MKFFKAKQYFNYRVMKNKIKKDYTHVHWIEGAWIDCKTEEDI